MPDGSPAGGDGSPRGASQSLDSLLGDLDFLDMLDGLPVGAALLDRDGRVLFLNRQMESLTGFGREEARGVPCRHILRSSACVRRCAGACPAGLVGGAAAGEQRSVEASIINRHRRKIAVRITSVPVRDRAGNPVLLLDVVEDLSALKELEARTSRVAGTDDLIGRSQEMERIFQLLPVLAQSDSPVLITGETGTGKDMVAEALHKNSPRSRDPFIRVSCSAMPEALLESELFGHKRGAFPWATEDKPGKLQFAAGGTLYLSEIGDLPPGLQAKLVRFLDEKVVYPVGGDAGVRLNVRLIAATNKCPEDLVQAGTLRQDLMHRLSAVRLHLPPLRERGLDIEFLLEHFLRIFAAKLKKRIKGFSPRAKRILLGHDYPGNVREMKNVVEYAVMVCQKEYVLPAHLPVHLLLTPAKGRRGGPVRSGPVRR